MDLGVPGYVLSVKCAPAQAELVTVFLSNVIQFDQETDASDVVTKVTAKVVWNFLLPAK
jgi:hypothetical protein